MTVREQALIDIYQAQGYENKWIASTLGLSLNAVKMYVSRHPLETTESPCELCGAPVEQRPHRKVKRFCSDACRMKWWYAHKDLLKAEKRYEHTCSYCGRAFTDQYKNRRFCSRRCFADMRRKAGDKGE